MRSTKRTVLARAAALTLIWAAAACSSAGAAKVCPVPEPGDAAKSPVLVKWANAEKTRVEYAYVHNGRVVTPAGRWTKTGTFPAGAALSPDGRRLAVAHSGGYDRDLKVETNQSVQIFDVTDGRRLQVIEERQVFIGAAWAKGGERLFISGGIADVVYVYDATAPAGLTKLREIPVYGVPIGVTATPDGARVLVTQSHPGTVAMINADTLEVEHVFDVLSFPIHITVDGSSRYAYVSNMGNKAVTKLDLQAKTVVGSGRTGNHPQGSALDGERLFVVESDDDAIAVLNTADLSLLKRIDLHTLYGPGRETPKGFNANDVRVRGGRVYVTLGGDNAVGVFDAATYAPLGLIPTGFYPTEIEFTDDALIVTNAKGVGSNPWTAADPSTWEDASNAVFFGGVQYLTPVPDAAGLVAGREQAFRNNYEAAAPVLSAGTGCTTLDSPIPTKAGRPSTRIEHVIYVVKENKTYDSLLGDLADDAFHDRGLAVFGNDAPVATPPAATGVAPGTRLKITPNTHALAKRFVNHVNFYTQSEKSTAGHMWLVGGWLNDWSEKAWIVWQIRGARLWFLPNIDPLTRTEDGDIFTHLKTNGVRSRIYGEFSGTGGQLFGERWDDIDTGYMFGITKTDDTKKVERFVNDVRAGSLAPFTYIWIPNDHTVSMSAGNPHPAYMVSDNDEALGMIVDAVSNSPFWERTAIFVVQDDPQSMPDHIDTHRSICLVISPWAKRGYTAQVRRGFANVHATMFRLLGVPPLSRYDALAEPMFDAFTTTPDLAPVPLTAQDPRLADREKWIIPEGAPLTAESKRIDLRLDRAEGMGEILWKAMRGLDAPLPPTLTDVLPRNAEAAR